MSFSVLLLCAVTRLMVCSTLEQVNPERSEELSAKLEQALIRISDIENVSQMFLEKFEELSSKLEQALTRMSDNEKASQMSIDDLTDSLRNERDRQLVMNNDLLLKVFDLQKKDLETFETIVNVQKEASRSDRVRADLIQVRLNETANMTHSCLASQTEIQVTIQKNTERLDLIEESNLSARMGNVESLFKTLRRDLDYVVNPQDDTLKLAVQNNTNDIGQLKQEISRVQNGTKCGVDFDNGGSNGGGNISSGLVWPWMAAMYKHNTSGSLHVCGGSVINRQFVLTSASCLDLSGNDRLSVKLGLSYLKNGTQLQEYRVRSVHMHPKFKRAPFKNYDYNIGLLELEQPIPFGPFVRPVGLPPTEIPQDELFYKPQSTAKAVYINEYISYPQTASPTVLNFTIHSQEECRRKIKEKDWEKFFPSPVLSFCAESSSTKCPKLGSPLMQSRVGGDGARTWTQVGIISSTPNNCNYFIIPRLDHLRAWVDTTLAAFSKR